MQIALRKKVAFIVIVGLFPLSLFRDFLVIIVNKIDGFAEFMIRWMKLWTGVE